MGDQVQLSATPDTVRGAFADADINRDGAMDKEEFLTLLNALSSGAWDAAKVDALFEAADIDESGRLDIKEVLDWIFEGDEDDSEEPPSPEEKILAAFEAVDRNRDGELSKKEFKNLLIELDPETWSKKTKINKLFKAADDDQDGSLDSTEVVQWILGLQAKARSMADEDLYICLSTREGSHNPLRLDDLLRNFNLCKGMGLNPKLTQLVPQNCLLTGLSQEPEDISPLEVAQLVQMLVDNSRASAEEAQEMISAVKHTLRKMDQGDLEAAGLDGGMSINVRVFRKLLDLLTALTGVDRCHFRAFLAGAWTGYFDMPDDMTNTVLQKLFSKEPGTAIDASDLEVLLGDVGMLDTTGTKGIARNTVSLLFQAVAKNMSDELEQRKLYLHPESSSKMKKKKNKAKKGRTRSTKGLKGSEELSILMEGIFQALPQPREYHSAADMTLNFLAAKE